VYALVFNMEWLATDDAAIRQRCLEYIQFWLDSITVYTYDEQEGVTASIVVVGTHKDRVDSPAAHEKINTLLFEMFSSAGIGRWPLRGPAISTLACQLFSLVCRCRETNISPVLRHRTGTLGFICLTRR